MTLVVSEIFGPTWQGEGPSVGRLAWFVRLGGCNLACSWCDTPYTWDASRFNLREEMQRMTAAQIVARLGDGLTVITGGEPLLQASALGDLVELLDGEIEVETNGTLPPPSWAPRANFNVSPKLLHSGNPSALAPEWYSQSNTRFKFVVRGVDDLEEVAAYGTPSCDTWIMPEGVEPGEILTTARAMADGVLARGWNLTLRQQTLLWASERGR